jgi:DNA-binding transcriptional LysR family regulator
MRLSQVQTFYWAGRLGNFARAAAQLNVTQSAVSMRIQELEASIGVKLFDRTQRVAKLTSAGVQLLPIAEQMMAINDQMMAFNGKKSSIVGYLRLGVVEIVALTWLPALIEKLRRDFPLVQVEVEVALSYLLEAKLNVGALDLIIAPCRMSQALFTHTSVGSVQFRWMCSSSLDVPRKVKASDLGDLPLIVTSRQEQFRGTLLEWSSDHQLRLNKPYICNNFTVASTLVASHLGVAFLPLPLYGAEIEARRFDLIECVPETPPMEHFVVAPRISPTLVQTVVQSAATLSSTFDPSNVAGDRN